MFIFLLIVFILLIVVYYYGTKDYGYWSKKGIKHDKPFPFIGNILWHMLRYISLSDMIEDLYWRYKHEKFVGQYWGKDRILLVRDPELAKYILVSDFNCFYARGLIPPELTEYVEPMFNNLFMTDGDKWKLLRQRMTSAFTTGKLKAMFPLIVERAERLQKIAHEAAQTGKEVDVRELMARYTTDFIGACAFGIDADSLNDQDSEFRKLGKRLFTITLPDAVRIACKMLFPKLLKNMYLMNPCIEKSVCELVNGIIKERGNKPSQRNDFIDLLMNIREQGTIVGESIDKVNQDGSKVPVSLIFDDMVLAAQVFIFFAAGFETSSSTTSFALHQLAYHPEIQEKCQKEIDEVLSKHGKLCYDAVKEMKYLEMCFKEGMRMFPSLGFLIRKCTSDFTFPGTDLTIDKGVSVIVSLQGMQNDPQYFENPWQFRPERFADTSNFKNHVYMPFGEGPRACIGERLGLMQSLTGLAAILSRFSVAPVPGKRMEPIRDPRTAIVQGIAGIPLHLIERNSSIC